MGREAEQMNNENKTLVMLSVSTTGLRTHQRARDELILWNPPCMYVLRQHACNARACVSACARETAKGKRAAFSRVRVRQVSRTGISI